MEKLNFEKKNKVYNKSTSFLGKSDEKTPGTSHQTLLAFNRDIAERTDIAQECLIQLQEGIFF